MVQGLDNHQVVPGAQKAKLVPVPGWWEAGGLFNGDNRPGVTFRLTPAATA